MAAVPVAASASWMPLAASALGAVGQAVGGGPKVSSSGPIYTDPYGMFDHSAWTVATGQAQASAAVEKPQPASLLGYLPWMVAGLVAVVAIKAWRK